MFSQFLIGLHEERLAYWTRQYEKEKQILLEQYANEIDSYKEKKFKAHKELECVYYALQNENDAQKEQDEKKHQEKIDDIKSKVLYIRCIFLVYFFLFEK